MLALRDVALALKDMHHRGFVHRDIHARTVSFDAVHDP